jgi:hypothetical protein
MSFRAHPFNGPPPLAVWVGGVRNIIIIYWGRILRTRSPPPPTHTTLSKEHFKINIDMKSAFDTPPVHKNIFYV